MAAHNISDVAASVPNQRKRRSGAGQIKPRGEGRWLIRYFVGMGPSTRTYRGKPIEGLVQKYRSQIVVGTKKDAERVLRDFLRKKDAGVVVEATRDTLDSYLDRWVKDAASPRLRERTLDEYEGQLRRYIRPAIGAVQLSKLTPLEIQAVYARMLAQGLSPRTVRYAHAVLHAALKQAVRWRILATNPAEAVDLPKDPKEEMKSLSKEQARKLLAVAPLPPAEKGKRAEVEARQRLRDHVLFALALASYMRPSEYLALRWSDLVDNAVRVVRKLTRRGKRWSFEDVKRKRSRRVIELDPETLRLLDAHRKRQAEERLAKGPAWIDHGLIFPDEFGMPERERTIVERFKRLIARAELPDVRLYDLRHTGISLMIADGVNPLVVSRRAGHASVAFTLDVYGHVLPGQDSDAAARIGAMLYG